MITIIKVLIAISIIPAAAFTMFAGFTLFSNKRRGRHSS